MCPVKTSPGSIWQRSGLPALSRWPAIVEGYLGACLARGFSQQTVENYRDHLRYFALWCSERSLAGPEQVTRAILERYQRAVYAHVQKDGRPLSVRTQCLRLSTLRSFFRHLTRQGLLPHNPASELELPRLGKYLPMQVLSFEEVERLLGVPDIGTALGLRDRTIMEVLYSTGIRRAELVHLELGDVDPGRGVLLVRQGKGRKDRVVPIGARAIAWVGKYLVEVRPRLVLDASERRLFLSHHGEPLKPDPVGNRVRRYLQASGVGKSGSCHLLRHSMATGMLEHGADIRYIQQMLGHERLASTQLYTHVSIAKLQQVHAATHPAEAGRTARLLRKEKERGADEGAAESFPEPGGLDEPV